MKTLLTLIALALSLLFVPPAYADAGVVVDAGFLEDAGVSTAPIDAGVGFVEGIEADPAAAAGALLQAVKGGQWKLVAAIVIVFAMLLLKKLRDKTQIFASRRGGAVLVALLSFGGTIAAALAIDVQVNWQLFAGALLITWAAAGSYHWLGDMLNGWGPWEKLKAIFPAGDK